MVTKKITDLLIDLPIITADKNGKQINDLSYTLFMYPNSTQTQADFLRKACLNLLGSGNLFIRKTLAGSRVVALNVLDSDECEYLCDGLGNPLWLQYNELGAIEKISLEDIWHIRFENVSGDKKEKLYGLSPLKAGWQIVNTSNHLFQTERLIYENRAINTILTNDSDRVILPKDKDDLTNAFNDDLSGTYKAGRVKVTSAKLRALDISMTPQQLQMNTSSTTKLRQICGLYSVPSFLFGDTERSTFSNLAEAKESMYLECVLPLAYFLLAEFTQLFQKEIKAKGILTIDEGEISALQTLDTELSDKVIKELSAGIITIDEARKLLNYGKEIV